ncbi:protein-L-isoaspartate O-methyltransferase, partial [bacterium F11]
MVHHQIELRGIKNPQVLSVMKTVKRHLFVPTAVQHLAYDDHPLAIGYGQTISQPYMVAAMTELLNPKPDHVVLEIGTGSGYQAAVLAAIVKQVYSIEIVKELALESEKRLQTLGYKNVTVKEGDGFNGWPEKGPFDGIVVTAAPKIIPAPLKDQLKIGGIMVIPV